MSFNISTLLHRAQAVSNDAFHRFHTKVLASTASTAATTPISSTFWRGSSALSKKVASSNDAHRTATTKTAFFMTQGLSEELVLTIAGFLDAASLCRLQQTSRQWRHHIVVHASTLWQGLAFKELGINPPMLANDVLGYLGTYQTAVEGELRHMNEVKAPYAALEQFCLAEPADHGIIGMFCDVCYFDDVCIGQAIAKQRFGAMAMVVVQQPRHVQRFRSASHYVDPKTPGFRGYAYNLVHMIPGYDHLKPTVVRAILKNIMVFDSAEHAAAYFTMSQTLAPFVTLDNAQPAYELGFASPLRGSLSALSMDQKVHTLTRWRDNTRHAMAYIQYGR
ncbi:hypothetical protein, variant [Aphanomyces astaci]|uniref:F-box domain-containing protein n=1 Tax=Aphanomyces astaci TaxID=112090 RepID=W4GE03_APHAT|nr:hypothetical protein, variant [Aphanomyces astaci]ETV77299.1 hypothetical protein, variant [Aphanomyces astaci]|eukprot:XP_009833086.1 hypothetical protein, variant [Aphanomyces astaci]